MSTPFTLEFMTRWSDVDGNNHMGNSSYLSHATQTRFVYFAKNGFEPHHFDALNLGLAAISDSVTYKSEIRFMQPITVELWCDGLNEARSKVRFRNIFRDQAGTELAQLTSLIIWFDKVKRKKTTPPEAAFTALGRLAKTSDFELLS